MHVHLHPVFIFLILYTIYNLKLQLHLYYELFNYYILTYI